MRVNPTKRKMIDSFLLNRSFKNDNRLFPNYFLKKPCDLRIHEEANLDASLIPFIKIELMTKRRFLKGG